MSSPAPSLPRDETPYSHRFRYRLAGVIGAGLLRALGGLWRVEWSQPESVVELERSGRPFVYAFWHCHLLPLAYTHRNRGVVILISQSADGEYISQVLHRLRYGTVRGSSSRGGVRALLRMARLGEAGHVLGVTPDGPRGPRQVLQPGVLTIAARSRLPIVPISAGVRRARRLSSWDRFEIPYPFAQVRVFTEPPLEVPATLPPEELERTFGPLAQAALDRVEARATRFANREEDA